MSDEHKHAGPVRKSQRIILMHTDLAKAVDREVKAGTVPSFETFVETATASFLESIYQLRRHAYAQQTAKAKEEHDRCFGNALHTLRSSSRWYRFTRVASRLASAVFVGEKDTL